MAEALAYQEAHVSAIVTSTEECPTGLGGLPKYGKLGILHAKVICKCWIALQMQRRGLQFSITARLETSIRLGFDAL